MPFISSMETGESTFEKPAEQWIPLVSGGKKFDEQSIARPVAETTCAVALGMPVRSPASAALSAKSHNLYGIHFFSCNSGGILTLDQLPLNV